LVTKICAAVEGAKFGFGFCAFMVIMVNVWRTASSVARCDGASLPGAGIEGYMDLPAITLL
jgi:hypothetical protein